LDKNFVSKRMKIIDLKKEEFFIEQYVNLRNSYVKLLLTLPVNISETKEWLKRNDIEIRGLAQDNVLLGVVILYLSRDGEIAFFAKQVNKRIGSRLLKIIKEVAKEKKLKFIWAWVLKDNFIAQRVFEKNGFVRGEISERIYNKKEYRGIIFRRVLRKQGLSK